MKKFLRSMLSVMTSLSLLSGTTTVCVSAYDDMQNTEEVTVDLSEAELFSGDFVCPEMIYSDFPAVLAEGSSETDGWLFRDCLDANNKTVYDALAELVTPSLDEIVIKLPEPVRFTTSDALSGTNEIYKNALFGTCASGFNAVLFDIPEIFWLSNSYSASFVESSMKQRYSASNRAYTYTATEIRIIPYCQNGFDSTDEIIEYKGILEKAVADFVVEGDTTLEKLRDIHNKIADFTTYQIESFSGSALGSLVTSKAVCEGYAKGFKMICDRENIPCICVFGEYDETKATAHMWNYVLMEDNCWYAVDVTWDDRDGRDGVDFYDRYFMKGSAVFDTDHDVCGNFDYARLKYPELAEWNYGENPAFTTTTESTTTTTTATTTTTTTTATTTTTTTSTTSTTTTTTTTTAPTTTTTATTTTTTTITTTTEPEKVFEYGDLNHDGKVSIADLVYCCYHVLNVEPAEYSCDLDGDDRVDVFDVIIMRQIVGEIIKSRFSK